MPSFWDVKAQTTSSKKSAGRSAARSAEPAGETMSVSELGKTIKGVLDRHLPDVLSVRGEIGTWNRAASGHRYFSLKDESASIDCKMWKSSVAGLKFEPQSGQEVVIRCRADFWAVRGSLSLVATSIEPVGQGALELAFQQTVERLRAEGLFEPGRKLAIPDYPQRVCLVTSLQAAGLADALKVLRRAKPVELSILPVAVQGEKAAPSIAAGLELISKHHAKLGIDVVLLIRGGGSIEDLWCFNEEIVARAVADCSVPIVTGIGHETDTTVADLVADYHAHTPTEAATHLVRHWRNARDRVEQLAVALRRDVRLLMRDRTQQLDRLAERPMFRRPTELVDLRRQQVDELQAGLERALRRLARETAMRISNAARRLEAHRPSHRVALLRERLSRREQALGELVRRLNVARVDHLRTVAKDLDRAAESSVRRQRQRLDGLSRRLERLSPTSRLQLAAGRVDAMASRLHRAADQATRTAAQHLSALEGKLQALDPTRVLGRGYSITMNKAGKVVRGKDDVRSGETIVTRVSDGEIESVVDARKQGELF